MTATGKATVTIDDAALKARMRGLLAQAWDEGRRAEYEYQQQNGLEELQRRQQRDLRRALWFGGIGFVLSLVGLALGLVAVMAT